MKILFVIICSVALCGCGYTPGQRALTGAGIGAGGAWLLGVNPLVGAAAGAGVGAVTSPAYRHW